MAGNESCRRRYSRVGLISAAVAAGVMAGVAAGCGGTPQPAARTEVVYFHRTIRCPACIQIEEWAKSAVAADVEAGRLTWRTLNLDEPANAQFEERYELTAQSVVIREFVGDNETRWKNFDRVWDLLDETSFKKYVEDEVRAFLAAKLK